MYDFFRNTWEYDADEMLWYCYDETESLRWCNEADPLKFPIAYKRQFLHHQKTMEILKSGWSIIHSLAVSELEKGKQEWCFEDEIYLNISDVMKSLRYFMNGNLIYTGAGTRFCLRKRIPVTRKQ